MLSTDVLWGKPRQLPLWFVETMNILKQLKTKSQCKDITPKACT